MFLDHIARLVFSPPPPRPERSTLVTGPLAAQIEAQRIEIDRLITANNRSVGIHRDVAGHVAGWPVRGKR